VPENICSVQIVSGRVYEYRKERQFLVGEGRFGTVYRGVNRQDSSDLVALKVLPFNMQRDRKRRTALRLEFEAMRNLRHENLERVFDLVEKPELTLVLELVSGVDLRAIIEKKNPFTLEQKIDVMVKTLRGLGCLHDHNIYHGDMKPDNVIVDWPTVKIVDYGMAQLGMPGAGIGAFLRSLLGKKSADEVEPLGASPAYMAPEQIEKRSINRRSDIYSTGMAFLYWFSRADWPVFPLVAVERGGMDERRMSRLLDRRSTEMDPERKMLVQMTVHDHMNSDIPPIQRSLTDEFAAQDEQQIRRELTRILFKMLRRDAYGRLGKNRNSAEKWFMDTYNNSAEVIKDVMFVKGLIQEARARAEQTAKKNDPPSSP